MLPSRLLAEVEEQCLLPVAGLDGELFGDGGLDTPPFHVQPHSVDQRLACGRRVALCPGPLAFKGELVVRECQGGGARPGNVTEKCVFFRGQDHAHAKQHARLGPATDIVPISAVGLLEWMTG